MEVMDMFFILIVMKFPQVYEYCQTPLIYTLNTYSF